MFWDRRPITRVSGRQQFLEKKTGEIVAREYLLSIANNVQKIGIGALLIVKNYILSSIWGNHSAYVIHLHSKNENGNVSSFGRKICPKFDASHFT